jgi:hypothetical protein
MDGYRRVWAGIDGYRYLEFSSTKAVLEGTGSRLKGVLATLKQRDNFVTKQKRFPD